jgi:SAM-dependent methyltransferase
VLDVGCGNGRFAAFLAGRGRRFRYLGIDASPALLERARERRLPVGTASYRCADFLETPPDECLPPRSFSLVALFGVLHHVPGREQRLRLLRALAARLRPGGLLALTSWQFEAFRRFRDRLLAWEDFNRSARDPIDLSQLEPGDHLLPWGEPGAPSGRALRFCHFTDDTEMGGLLAEASLDCVAAFSADGREGNLNRYFTLRSRG